MACLSTVVRSRRNLTSCAARCGFRPLLALVARGFAWLWILGTLLHAAASLPSAAAQEVVDWPEVTNTERPWTRWWWHGSSVEPAELSAAMQTYAAAGLGGLEITPIYGVIGDESNFVDFLSPKWMDLLEHTLVEAERLDLGIDMATGTGWPFGGPWVTGEHSARTLVVDTLRLRGGHPVRMPIVRRQEPYLRAIGSRVYELEESLEADDETQQRPGEAPPAREPSESIDISDLKQPVSANENLQRLALEQVRFDRELPLVALVARDDSGEVVDLTGHVENGLLQWDAPGGEWTVFAVFQGRHGKMVERAAPGGEGYVIDHFSPEALQIHLSQFDRAFEARDVDGLRAFFNDSYEVDDAQGEANWTPAFFDEFETRRGYDLRPHLPALLSGEASDHAARVLSDYRETISDLLLESFTRPWDAWAEGYGAATRNQAHGSPANILDLYAAADIPETEGTDLFRIKMASSAANVSGKPLASAEAATWLDEHFLSNLADLKASLDRYWLGGINHVFYHGTVFSPRSDPWPGRLFYAAVHLTPANPLWNDFDALNRYAARVQSFLQDGEPDNDVLLYYPVYDRFAARTGSLLAHFDGGLDPFEGSALVEAAETMDRAGYAFDFISDRQIQSTEVTEGDLATAGGPYRTLVLPKSQFIPAETFSRLMTLVGEGATIIVYGGLPDDLPGYYDVEARRAAFRRLIDGLAFEPTESEQVQEAKVGDGRVLLGDDLERLLHHAGIERESLVDDGLAFVRRRREQGTAYFVVNRRSEPFEGWIPLSTPARSVVVFDPKFGATGMARTREAGGGFLETYVQIPAGESLLLQTLGESPRAPQYPYTTASGDTVELSGEWTVRFVDGGPELPEEVTGVELESWTDLGGADAKDFSGTAVYSLSFPRPEGEGDAFVLDLGRVHESADVFLNGEEYGTVIGPTYRLVLPRSAFGPENTLEVRVSNLMANRIAELDRRGVLWKRFYNINFPPRLPENRNELGLFDASNWPPRPSGLLGPVTLTPVTISQ